MSAGGRNLPPSAKVRAKRREATEAELVYRGVTDPVWWLEEGCGWPLWEKQREIARALVTRDRVAVPAAFGVGKTWVASRLALWWLYTHYPAIVVTTAPTGRQVRDLLWAEIRQGHVSSKLALGGECLTTDLRLEPKWFATGFATKEENIDKFTGYHSPNMLLIFDQACGIHKQIWSAGEGLLTSENCRWLALSNTTEENSEFANICLPDRRSDYGEWEVIKIKAHDSPNVIAGTNIFPGILSADYVEKKKKVWRLGDPLWEIYIEANFVESSSMTVLHPSMVKEILGESPTSPTIEPDYENMVLAVDVGDEGTDPSVCALGLGNRLGFIKRVLGNDTMQTVKFVIECWDDTIRLTGKKPIAIYIDRIGVGAGVLSRLSELNYPAIGVNVGMKAIDDTEYINRRIEMAWSLRHLAEARALSWVPVYFTEPEVMEMLREDMSIRYEALPSQRIKLEDKVKFRRRTKRSSDFWDVMMMAFAGSGTMPVITSFEPEGYTRRTMEQRLNDIDPAEAAASLKIVQKLFGMGLMRESDFGDETFL
jgi:hypothetical protein